MECVCAIAVVGLMSALILPLISTSLNAFKSAQSLREVAAEAANKNATNKTVTGKNGNTKVFYVEIDYTSLDNTYATSAFMFTESKASDSASKTEVTYYDLKYGMETKDPS